MRLARTHDGPALIMASLRTYPLAAAAAAAQASFDRTRIWSHDSCLDFSPYKGGRVRRMVRLSEGVFLSYILLTNYTIRLDQRCL